MSVAKFQGGGAFNVIPDSVTIGGTFRAFSKESFAQLKQRIKEVTITAAITLFSLFFVVFGLGVFRKCFSLYYFRMLSLFLLQLQVVTKQASVHRCNATIDFLSDKKPFYPVTVNNKDLHSHFQNVAKDLLGAQNIKEMQPLMGSEDFSFFAEAIPGYFFFLGMKMETEGNVGLGHSPFFKVNEDVLPYGAALHASLAARYLLEFQPKSTLPKLNLHDEL